MLKTKVSNFKGTFTNYKYPIRPQQVS